MSYAEFRFRQFCSETEDLETLVSRVLESASEKCLDVENAALDGTEIVYGAEVQRIRKETAEALQKIVSEYQNG